MGEKKKRNLGEFPSNLCQGLPLTLPIPFPGPSRCVLPLCRSQAAMADALCPAPHPWPCTSRQAHQWPPQWHGADCLTTLLSSSSTSPSLCSLLFWIVQHMYTLFATETSHDIILPCSTIIESLLQLHTHAFWLEGGGFCYRTSHVCEAQEVYKSKLRALTI